MAQRQLPEDFKDFINFLNGNDVCYLFIYDHLSQFFIIFILYSFFGFFNLFTMRSKSEM